MSEQVRVEDMEVFRTFRAALLKFAQAADQSLSSADSEIARMRFWLEGEQTTYWNSQLRKRTEAVTIAREAVRQKKLFKDFSGQMRDALPEEKALAKCNQAQEQAREKLEAIKKWVPRLEKESNGYRSGVAALGRAIIGDIPKAVALLDRLAGTLEQYLQIAAPLERSADAGEPTGYEGTFSRGDGDKTEAPPAALPSQNETASKMEGGHVADRQ